MPPVWLSHRALLRPLYDIVAPVGILQHGVFIIFVLVLILSWFGFTAVCWLRAFRASALEIGCLPGGFVQQAPARGGSTQAGTRDNGRKILLNYFITWYCLPVYACSCLCSAFLGVCTSRLFLGVFLGMCVTVTGCSSGSSLSQHAAKPALPWVCVRGFAIVKSIS